MGQVKSMYEIIIKAANENSIKAALEGVDFKKKDENGKLFIDYVIDYRKVELIPFCYDEKLFEVEKGLIVVNGKLYDRYEELIPLLFEIRHQSLNKIGLDSFKSNTLIDALHKFIESGSTGQNFRLLQNISQDELVIKISLNSILENNVIDDRYVRAAWKIPGFKDRFFTSDNIKKLLSTDKGQEILFILSNPSNPSNFQNEIKCQLSDDLLYDYNKIMDYQQIEECFRDKNKLANISIPELFEKKRFDLIDRYLSTLQITSADQIKSCCKVIDHSKSIWTYYDNEDLIVYLTKKGIQVPKYETGYGEDTNTVIDTKYLAIVLKYLLNDK